MTRLSITAALAAASIFATSAAVADVHWVVAGTFDDGTTLSGYFNIDTYGYLGTYDLTTRAGPVLAASIYENDSTAQGVSSVDFQPTYTQDLHLDFANPIGVAAPSDPLLITSYECVNSYGCAGASGGDRRYLVSGFASAPEPAAWALMLVGVAGLGLSLRARRPSPAR
jgi:hypothetical protein